MGLNPSLKKCRRDSAHEFRRFSGEFPIIGSCPVYATLMQVACDNLALDGILGVIESFSADFLYEVLFSAVRLSEQI